MFLGMCRGKRSMIFYVTKSSVYDSGPDLCPAGVRCPGGEPLQSFPFAVRRVEYLGSDRYVYGTVADGAGDDATVIAKLPATVGTTIPEGETVEFAVPRRALHYFDGASGVRRR